MSLKSDCNVIRRIIVLPVLLMAVFLSYAQDDEMPGFTVYVLEDTVYQGDSVHVVYSIEVSKTMAFSYSSDDARMEGGELKGVLGYHSTDSGKTWNRVFNATFLVKGCGELAILPMKIMLNDRPVYSDTVWINVLPDPVYGNEWTQARYFLSQQGVKSRNLTFKYGTETIKAFSDNEEKSFIIIASSPYDQYLSNPILAYGIGNSMWNGVDKQQDNSVYHIMERYDYQLKELRKRNIVYKGIDMRGFELDPGGVTPLLGDLNYDQAAPYNNKFPQEEWGGRKVNCIAGCGPVALAEVLSYHHSSRASEGYATFSTNSGLEYAIDLDDYPFSWGGNDEDKAALMMSCAATLGARMSPWATKTSLCDFKSALLVFWGYDPQCIRTEKGDYVDMLTMLYKEIDASRPVIVADDEHIFVCDGYYGDFLHFNLGWKGYCNGYYRIIVLPSLPEWQLPFSEILTNIKPLDRDEMTGDVTVKVKKAGQLREQLEESGYDIMKITSLSVSGPIDGDDIQLIRTMAGASVKRISNGRIGSLMHLDLSGATIKGGKPYATVRGDEITVSRQVKDVEVDSLYDYVLSHVSDEDWVAIRSEGNDKLVGMNLERDMDGTVYALCHVPDDNVIGIYMFNDCENLVTLTLPKKAARVNRFAFKNCRSLKDIGNLPQIVLREAFYNNRFLEYEYE